MTVNVYRFYDTTHPVSLEIASELDRYRKYRVFKALRKVLWSKISVSGDAINMLITFTLSLIAAILLIFLHGNILAGCFIFFSLCIYLSLFIGALRDNISKVFMVTQESGL